jgi:hypothetical protein
MSSLKRLRVQTAIEEVSKMAQRCHPLDQRSAIAEVFRDLSINLSEILVMDLANMVLSFLCVIETQQDRSWKVLDDHDLRVGTDKDAPKTRYVYLWDGKSADDLPGDSISVFAAIFTRPNPFSLEDLDCCGHFSAFSKKEYAKRDEEVRNFSARGNWPWKLEKGFLRESKNLYAIRTGAWTGEEKALVLLESAPDRNFFEDLSFTGSLYVNAPDETEYLEELSHGAYKDLRLCSGRIWFTGDGWVHYASGEFVPFSGINDVCLLHGEIYRKKSDTNIEYYDISERKDEKTVVGKCIVLSHVMKIYYGEIALDMDTTIFGSNIDFSLPKDARIELDSGDDYHTDSGWSIRTGPWHPRIPGRLYEL